MSYARRLFVLLALYAVVACVAPTPPLPSLVQQASQRFPEAPPVAAAVLEGDGATAPSDKFGKAGRYRVLHAASACENPLRQGAPLVWPDRSAPPTVGEPTRVQWTATPSAPFVDTPQAVLLVSFGRREPILLTDAGYPGCWLHVDPDPRNLFTIMPAAGSTLTHDGGRIWLHWTPPAALAGVEIVAQLIIATPGANPGGWLLSPGLEMWIGSGQ